MLTVVLTRHGETDKSHPEQYLGQKVQARLTEVGREAARRLGDRLAAVEVARVVASPLERARETARLIRPDVEPESDDRLMEADYGEWEGLTVERIEAGWPEHRRAWAVDPVRLGPPGGETGEDVGRRVRSLLEDLVEWGAEPTRADVEQRVLVVGHSTVNRVLLSIALGSPLRDFRRRYAQSWANLTVLRFGGSIEEGAKLMVANDVSHIHGVAGVTWE